MKKIIIIPAYNEEKNIAEVVNNLKKETSDYDYIIINDGSKDNTIKECIENELKVISLPINLGIGGAVQTGYKYALDNDYDIAVQIDGDGQHDVTYLDVLLKKLIDENADMCIGSRFLKKQGFQSTIMRRFGKDIISIFIKILTGKKISDPTSGFRMCNKKVIKMFANKYPYDYPEPETIVRLIKNKCEVVEVPVIMQERQGGKSSITPIKSITYMFKVLVAITFAKMERREI